MRCNDKLFSIQEAEINAIRRKAEATENSIEYILRNKIKKPIKGKITRGKIRRRGIKMIFQKPPGVHFGGYVHRGIQEKSGEIHWLY